MLIQGTAKWAKITGKPHPGFEGKFNEWSIDVYIDAATSQKLKDEGLGPKIKDKGNGEYMSFKRKEFGIDKVTGQQKANQPIRIVDDHGELWDPNNKIGNGSVVNVNFAINEFGKGKNDKAANILSLQVWDWVKYEGGEFAVREGPAKEAEDWSQEEDAA